MSSKKARKNSTQKPKATSGGSEPIVVGIGASAGGLAALRRFFSKVPSDSGLAYVVVVHLSPEHESHLADLLQPHVSIPVRQVTETVQLKPNQVYVIPPNANLDTIDTHLRLSELEEKRRERAPIDHFFRTLADTHDGNAVGIILSGTGSDGTLGVKDIKGKGGIIVVQDPGEAEYDGMPQSAVATGLADLILPIEKIPQALLQLVRTQPRVRVPAEGEEPDQDEVRQLQKIFAQLRARTERDFSRYKRSTVLRRITRRMQLNHLEDLPAYVELLRGNPAEVRTLGDDLLITVTHFFRDHHVFEKLASEVVPRLFADKAGDDTIRVWSVGCATGEEAYSLAMLLVEGTAMLEDPPRVQVFASDLHAQSLERAREGFYPGDIEAEVSADRLKRFFRKENGGYRINREIRDLVVFAPHNLLSDPPFSRLDLVCCRNLLIYLLRDAQRDVIELFHYALNPDGWLLLGASETVEAADLFRTEDKKLCLYRKRNVPAVEPRLPVFPRMRSVQLGQSKIKHPRESIAYGALMQQLVQRHAPPSLLVSPDNKLVQLSEDAGRYLLHPSGEVTSNVFKLLRKELRLEVQASLQTVRENKQGVNSRPVLVQFDGDRRSVILHLRPALEPEYEGYVLVMFEEREPEDKASEKPKGRSESRARRERELELELGASRQRLQAIVEEYETSQEEMRASSEEMQSTNEELRSTMEELETSKEELQSINEELQTVNQENRHKVEELAQVSSDLQNLLAATDIATLFLDRNLRIVRFTPRVSDLFNIRVTDRGRPILDLTHRLGYDELGRDAKTVLDRLTPIEREVQDEENRWYLTRVLPYRSTEDRIEGVVITFVDITTRKQVEAEVREAKLYAESIIETLHEPLLVLTADLKVKSANRAFYEAFHVSEIVTQGQRVYDLGNGQWDIPALRRLLEEVLPENQVFNDFEVNHEFDDIGERVMLLNGRQLEDAQLILLGIRDITANKQAEEALRASQEQLAGELDVMRRLHALVTRLLECPDLDSALQVVLEASAEITRAPMGNIQLLDESTQTLKIVSSLGFGQDFLDRFGEVSAEHETACGRALRRRSRAIVEDVETDEAYAPYRDAAAAAGYPSVQSTPLLSRTGKVLGILSTHYPEPHVLQERTLALLDLYARQAADVVERVASEEKLRRSEERYRLLVENAHEYAIFMIDLQGIITTWNTGAERIFGYSEGEVVGRPALLIFPAGARDADAAQTEMDIAAREGHAADERWHVRKDGSSFWASGSMEPLRTADGTIRGFVKVLRDNTERKAAEDQLRDLNESLEKRVEERTKDVRELASRLTMAEHQERDRIAHVLHDDLQQALYSIQIKLMFLHEQIERLGAGETTKEFRGDLTDRVSTAQQELGQAIETARSLSVDLSPQVLETEGLKEALIWLAEHMQEQHNITIDVKGNGQVAMPKDLGVLIFHVVRELLFNVVKHAGVKKAQVELDRNDDEIRIRVRDHGKGFDSGESTGSKHFGLLNAKHRLSLVGAQLDIDSAVGQGTTMTILVPHDRIAETDG